MIDLCPCQHDNGYMDGRSQIKVHTDERTQVHSAHSALAVTHPGTNRARRYLTSVTESPSKHWSPLWTFHVARTLMPVDRLRDVPERAINVTQEPVHLSAITDLQSVTMCEPRLKSSKSTLKGQVTGGGESNLTQPLFGEPADRGQGSDD